MDTADFKENMYRRLRSAKQWLNQAEDAFQKDRDIRAELDLMLAQAELQHAKEANRTRHWRYKYSLLTQGAAVGLAITIAAVGFGSTYWWYGKHQSSSYQTTPVLQEQIQLPEPPTALISPPETQQKVAVVQPSVTVKSNSAPTAVKPVTQQKVNSSETRSEAEQPSEQEHKVVLPPDEMQKLVRAAGKSLRGQ